MNRLVKGALLALLISICAALGIAQEQDKPMPDRWRGLILDQSTAEDAIKILGKPAKETVGSGPVQVDPISNWLTKQKHEKGFRILEFKQPLGMKHVYLMFLNDKLVMISLRLEKSISPEALANIYGIPFNPAIRSLDIAVSSKEYERNQGQIYPKTYPVVYHMVGVGDRSFVSAMVSNVPSFGGALARSAGVPDKPGSFPGKIEFITLVSRALENHDGTNVLK